MGSGGDSSEGFFTPLHVGFQTEGHLAPEDEDGIPGRIHDVQDDLESVRCLATRGRWGGSHFEQGLHTKPFVYQPYKADLLLHVRGRWERREWHASTRGQDKSSGPQKGGPPARRQEVEEGSRDREFKAGLALSLSEDGFFSPQLWFVYFDLENCVQFLSDHVQEMKTNQEVRYFK